MSDLIIEGKLCSALPVVSCPEAGGTKAILMLIELGSLIGILWTVRRLLSSTTQLSVRLQVVAASTRPCMPYDERSPSGCYSIHIANVDHSTVHGAIFRSLDPERSGRQSQT